MRRIGVPVRSISMEMSRISRKRKGPGTSFVPQRASMHRGARRGREAGFRLGLPLECTPRAASTGAGPNERRPPARALSPRVP
jgi:hypothetical protein